MAAASARANAPDCAAEESLTRPECFEVWRARCPSGSADAACLAFAKNFCAPSTPKNGVATSYCSQRVADEFCKSSGRAACLSCLPEAVSARAACNGDGSACRPQYSEAQINQARQSCPTDPVFSDPVFAQSLEKPIAIASTTSSSLRPEIGAQYGQNLFAVTSSVIRARCEAGRLNNCR